MREPNEWFQLAFLILIGTVAAIPAPFGDGPLERINIQRDTLRQMCDLRGETLYDNILSFDLSLGSHLSYFFEARPNGSSADEAKWKQESQNECEKDSISELKLQRLLNTVQLCMNEGDHPQYDEDPQFMSRLLKELCKLYSQGGRKIPDIPCIQTTERRQHLIRRTFVEIDALLLPLIYNAEECSEVRKFFDCLEDGMRNNETAVKNKMKAASNILFYSLYGCTDAQPFVEALSFNEVPAKTQSLSRSKRTVRFPLTKSNLRQKCEETGHSFTKKFDNTLAEYIAVFVRKQFLLTLSADLQGLTDRQKLNNLVNQNCYNDTEMKETFENIFDAVQDCLDVEDRLNEEGKQRMLNESLKVTCYVVDNNLYISSQDKECFNDFGKVFKKVICDQNASIEPLSFGVVPEECNKLYEMQNCELEIFDNCKESTKLGIRKQFNEIRKFNGCNDMYEAQV